MPDELEVVAVDLHDKDEVDKAPRAPVSPACGIKNRSNAVCIFLGAKNLGLPQAFNVKRRAGPPASVLDPILKQVCLKGVRHLKNCKFTKLAAAVEGTRKIWPAEVDRRAALPQSGVIVGHEAAVPRGG